MKLAYIAHTNLPPHDWAHSLQIINMCKAFANQGVEVTLYVPKRNLPLPDDLFKEHGSLPRFSIRQVPCIDVGVGSSHVFFYWLRFISFLISARILLFFVQYDVAYTRDLYITPFFRKVFLESHSFPKTQRGIHAFIFKKVSGIVVLTSFIKAKLVALGISPEKVYVAPDAVSIEDMSTDISIAAAREKLQLSTDIHLIGYIGALKTMAMEKGVATAIDSLAFLGVNYMLYIVGGEKQDIEFYSAYAAEKNLSSRVIFVGQIPHKEVSLHMAACDVLVAPFPDIEHYRHYMSPLKIFEYMASKRPIITTNLPSLQEVLTDGEDALLIAPSSPEALGEAIQRLSEDKALGERLAQKAYFKVVERYTWNIRAKNILEFIKLKVKSEK